MRKLLIVSILWTLGWWIIAWTRIPLASEYSFFPLWLGYIFTTNGISELIYHDSLLRRMRWQFALLFIVSVPMWWFFEWADSYLQN